MSSEWYVSLSYDILGITTPKKTDVVGVDLGLKILATLSDAQVFESVKYYGKFETKLSRMQYLNPNKEIGSANWKKAQLRIARLHGKIANIRKDAVHKLITYASLEPRCCCH